MPFSTVSTSIRHIWTSQRSVDTPNPANFSQKSVFFVYIVSASLEMVSHANDPRIEMQPCPSVHSPSHEVQPNQSSIRIDINPIDPLLNHTVPPGTPRFNIPPKRDVTAHNTVLLTRFEQHTVSLSLSVLAILLLGFSTWFIYTEFISWKPLSPALQLSTSHTINTVNILSHLNVFLVFLLLESASEALRWSLASRTKGVSITTFLALSRATGISGVTDLLRVPGCHRFWCILKLVHHRFSRPLSCIMLNALRLLSKGLCWFLSLVLLGRLTILTSTGLTLT